MKVDMQLFEYAELLTCGKRAVVPGLKLGSVGDLVSPDLAARKLPRAAWHPNNGTFPVSDGAEEIPLPAPEVARPPTER